MGLEDTVYVGSRPNFEAHGANCIGLDAVEIMKFPRMRNLTAKHHHCALSTRAGR